MQSRLTGVDRVRPTMNPRESNESPSQEATRIAEIEVTVAIGCFLRGVSQPAESHGWGIENTDQPQSRQTVTSGDGVTGGWLRVRGEFLYKRISAGIVATESDWHFGQFTHLPHCESWSLSGR